MYVIYPADELINFDIAREYVSSQSPTLASDLSTPTGFTTVLLDQNYSGHPIESATGDSVQHETIRGPGGHTYLQAEVGTTLSTAFNQEDQITCSASELAPECTTDPSEGKPSRRRRSKLTVRTLNFRPFRKISDETQSGINDDLVVHKDAKVIKVGRGRSIVPSVKLTPITGAFDDHFVNYREQNSSNPQPIKLLHSHTAFHKSKASEDQTSPNFAVYNLFSGFNHAYRCTQPVSLSRASSPGGTSLKMNTLFGASQSNIGTMSNLPVTNAVSDPSSFKDLLHPSLNETLKGHNALTFKLIRIGKFLILST